MSQRDKRYTSRFAPLCPLEIFSRLKCLKLHWDTLLSLSLKRTPFPVPLYSTVGLKPTLSAGRKILVAVKAAHYRQPQSFGDMVLTDRGLTTEIAQFQLGDLTF